MTYHPPEHNCPLCPRFVAFHKANRIKYPGFFNAPVPSFGEFNAGLLVVGLAPGLKGANQTGRPFTGDYAGIILYSSLKKFGFAEGEYEPERVNSGRWTVDGEKNTHHSPSTIHHPPPSTDNFSLINCRITNAVRCVPPENKPEPSEIKQCNNFLKSEIAAMPNLKIILTLGLISHKAVLMALGLKQSAYKFGHGVEHVILGEALPSRGSHATPQDPHTREARVRMTTLLNSYHCSRYNINTGVLTQAMFDKVVEQASYLLGPS